MLKNQYVASELMMSRLREINNQVQISDDKAKDRHNAIHNKDADVK